jgi:hypothetical protein
MFVRASLFALFTLLTVWLFANVIHVASGEGLTLAFGASGYSAAQNPPAAAPNPEPSASAAVPERSASGATAGEKLKALPKLVVPRDIGLLSTLFAICGALGATLHAMGSLVAFAGNEKFNDSWALWYLAQPLRGGILASGFFWLVRGGLLGVSGGLKARKNGG